MMVHFDHPVAKGFDAFPGLVPEPHILQVLDKRADCGRIDMLLILYDDAEYLGPGGVVPETFLNGFPETERDVCDHILSAPRDIVAVKVAGLVPEPHFLQVLDKHADCERIDLLLILYDDAKDLGPGGVVPEAFLNGFPDLEHDVCEHILSVSREIVAVKVADREKMSSSIP